MDWTTYQDRAGLSFSHPIGWTVQSLPGPGAIVRSPDGHSMALINHLSGVENLSGAEIIREGKFPAMFLFPGAKPLRIAPGLSNSVNATLSYTTDAGPGLASLTYIAFPGGRGLIYGSAAPESYHPVMAPFLFGVTQSMSLKPLPAPAAGPISYTRFSEPQLGTFTIDMPVGWQAGGGFVHPTPGDRRPWFEASSPDGIYILSDPAFPQNFSHFRGYGEGNYVMPAAGGLFLNLTPAADRLADQYLKRVGSERLGAFQIGQRRPRPDAVNLVVAKLKQMGIAIKKSFQITAAETMLQLTGGKSPRVASLLATAVFNGEYGMGIWGFWDANVFLYLAPPDLAMQAEHVRMHMITSHKFGPAMMQIYQGDESIIWANAQAANAAQWGWFAGQQQAHFAQVAAGDAIVNNYWRQQHANDAMLRGWEQNQAINDRLSQDRSDAMLGKQRLEDASEGKEYSVPAGSNYFWRNQQTGQIIGTETDTPPDYSNNYTALRKL